MHASINYSINGWGGLMSLMEAVFLFYCADMFLARLPFLRCLECEKRGPPFYGLGALWFNVWCVLSEPLSLSITLYEPITQCPVLHPAPHLFFFSSLTSVFPPSSSPKASLSPDRLAGDKNLELGRGEGHLGARWQGGRWSHTYLESFFCLCGSRRYKEVGHLFCMCAASSCAAPVDNVVFRFSGWQATVCRSWMHLRLNI